MRMQPRTKLLVWIGLALMLLAGRAGVANAQWTNMATTNSFPGSGNTFACLLLTDATVMCQEYGTNHWHRLVPDQNGSYRTGTWDPPGKTIADMPNGKDTSVANPTPPPNVSGPCNPCTYGPTFYASAVLADGRVVVIGGEYNTNGNTWTNIGFLYDPVANSWSTQLTEPFGTGNIGDSQSVVLPNGTMLIANISNTQMASFDPSTLTFTAIAAPAFPFTKVDRNDEEGWHILPNGKVLTVNSRTSNSFEVYDPALNQWTHGSTAGVTMGDIGGKCNSAEVGPGILRPNGTMVYFSGGDAGQNAVYDVATNTWSHPANVDFPIIGGVQYTVPDGPAAVLPNGHVLVQANPICADTGKTDSMGNEIFSPFNTPSHYFEWDGTNLAQVADAANNGNFNAYQGRMLVLPTGEILYTAFDQSSTQTIQLYSNGGGPDDAWRPVITAGPKSVDPGTSYSISGKLFNGLSEGAAYGDDAQMSTNYPIVRITNRGTHHVFYARTHDHSRMGVESVGDDTIISTTFDTPGDLESGISDLEVVANGIPSLKWVVNGPGLTLTGPLNFDTCLGATATTTLNVCNTGKSDLVINNITSSNPQFSVFNPGYSLVISPDFCFPFQAQYTPSAFTTSGPLNATLSIASNDPNSPVTSEPVSGTATPPSATISMVRNGVFPNTCPGSFSDAPVLYVSNSSQCSLTISSIVSSTTQFTTPTLNPATPLVVAGHQTIPLPIRFTEPLGPLGSPQTGTRMARIDVSSNDPANPTLSQNVSAFVPAPKLNATIAANGNYGNVCAGNQLDLNLTLLNQGECNLNVMSLVAAGNYTAPTVSTPLVLSHDATVNLPIRFTPTGVCSNTIPQPGNLTINSNDASAPFVQPLSGIEGCPKIVLSPANLTGVFAFPPTVTDTTGNLGCYTDRQITIANSGICPLTITNLSAGPSDTFSIVTPAAPLTIGPGASPVPITVRFKPTTLTGQIPTAPDQRTGTFSITSNDPSNPLPSAQLCGEPVTRSGIRVLVTDSTISPINPLKSLTLSSSGLSPQFSQKLTDVVPASTSLCGNPPNSIVYHLDNETLPPAGTTGNNPKASYTLTAQNSSKPISMSFTLGQCDFKVFTLQYK
jgi:hypothetical protein